LLNAGLFPRLRDAGFLPIPIRLDHSADRPYYVGARPFVPIPLARWKRRCLRHRLWH
jgi:hypothetical protein